MCDYGLKLLKDHELSIVSLEYILCTSASTASPKLKLDRTVMATFPQDLRNINRSLAWQLITSRWTLRSVLPRYSNRSASWQNTHHSQRETQPRLANGSPRTRLTIISLRITIAVIPLPVCLGGLSRVRLTTVECVPELLFPRQINHTRQSCPDCESLRARR